jgi:hypothetical protein
METQGLRSVALVTTNYETADLRAPRSSNFQMRRRFTSGWGVARGISASLRGWVTQRRAPLKPCSGLWASQFKDGGQAWTAVIGSTWLIRPGTRGYQSRCKREWSKGHRKRPNKAILPLSGVGLSMHAASVYGRLPLPSLTQ